MAARKRFERKPRGDHTFIRDWMPAGVKRNCSMKTKYDLVVECPGCQDQYPAKYKNSKCSAIDFRQDFVVHCIEDCELFQELGLDWECEICHKKFLVNLHGRHGCTNVGPKSTWTDKLYLQFNVWDANGELVQGPSMTSRLPPTRPKTNSVPQMKRKASPSPMKRAIKRPRLDELDPLDPLEFYSSPPKATAIKKAVDRPYMGRFPNENIDYTLPIPNDDYFGHLTVRDMVNNPFDPREDCRIARSNPETMDDVPMDDLDDEFDD